jgi:CBS-domain-containing membrane protein
MAPTNPLGPKIYDPPKRPSDPDKIIAILQRERDEIVPANSATENLSALIRRVSGQSMEEIDLVIRELENVRDMLRNEGERVVREIAGYARLSHSLMSATKMIADNVKQWKQPGS